MIEQIKITSKEVYVFLTGPRETQNVTEWAKKEKCWKNAQKKEWRILPEFQDSLVEITKEKKSTITESTVDSMTFITNKTLDEWKDLKEWGKKYLYLTLKEESSLDMAIKIYTHGRIPTERQFKEIVRIYNSLISKGYA